MARGRGLTAERGELCSEWFQHFLATTDKRLVLSTSAEGLAHSLSSGYFLFLAVRAEKSNISWNCSQKLNIQKVARTCCGYPTHFWRHLYLHHLMISPRDPGQLCFPQSTRTHTNLTHTDLEGKKLPHEGHKAK